MNRKPAKKSRVRCAIAGCLAWYARMTVGATVLTGTFAVSRAVETDLPAPASALTNVSEAHQLAEQKQRVQCAVRLEGIVLWASAASGQFVLQDDSGVVFVQAEPQVQTFQPGQRLVVAGNCVAEEDRLILGIQPVVDNEGLHIMTEKSGKVFLRAGKHQIRLSWFNREPPSGLEVYYQGPNLAQAMSLGVGCVMRASILTINTLQWAWSLMRSAVAPNSRPQSSE